MAFTISFTQVFRASAGGKAWRCYRFDHEVTGSMEVSAASLDLTYIDCVVGEHSGIPIAVDNVGSAVCRMGVSILANNEGLRWIGSTEAITQYITIVGW
jgi:hypothetical protein